jgi:Protein of unknown function (DUF3800)
VAYLLFVDESGQDRQHSPYEVLAGVAVHDSEVWDLVSEIGEAESGFFGSRITLGTDELKARTLLNRKTFRLAAQMPPFPDNERVDLAQAARLDGAHATRAQITALAQAQIAYCRFVLERCAAHATRVFASAVEIDAPRPSGRMLRKDYAFLFERFYYFVDQQQDHERGLVIFDELERSQAHILVDQMARYFRDTRTGRTRSGRIIPEPLFVHSDLSTLIQVADLVAYVISWNVRVGVMGKPARSELDPLGRLILDLRHRAVVDQPGYANGFIVWSIAVIDDLRPLQEIRFEEEFAQKFDEEMARRAPPD